MSVSNSGKVEIFKLLLSENPVSSIGYRNFLASHSLYGPVAIFIPDSLTQTLLMYSFTRYLCKPVSKLLQEKCFLNINVFTIRLCKNYLEVTMGGVEQS